jgi:hypothetical protein
MNKWICGDTYNPEDYTGFVYKITNLTNGKFYIGKKSFFHNTNVKLGKKELAALPTARGKKPSTKLVIKESNWKDYWGSNKELIQDVKELGSEHFECLILRLCKTKKQLTYFEVHYQCTSDCLLGANSYNDNILAKFFRRDFI